METTYEEFQIHYRYISHVIDFLTAIQDGRRMLEEISQQSISELTRSLRRLLHSFDQFTLFTKLVLNPTDPENPEGPETSL